MTRLDELEALLAKATPGPWTPYERLNAVYAWQDEPERGGKNICGMWDGGQTRESINANCELICAMRNALPKLVAVARAAEECKRTNTGSGWHSEAHDAAHDALGNALARLEGKRLN